MSKNILVYVILIFFTFSNYAFAETKAETSPLVNIDETNNNKKFLKASITKQESTEILKSTIFDASQSFIPEEIKNTVFEWDFGDGTKSEGIEVLHTYQNPGSYIVKLKIFEKENPTNFSEDKIDIFAYRKLIVLITDINEKKDWIPHEKDYAATQGVFLKIFESFGSNTEFISEEILAKKISEEVSVLQKAEDIVLWTNSNAGLNALSRNIQYPQIKNKINLSQKNIIVIDTDLEKNILRIQKQFQLFQNKEFLLAKEAAITILIDSKNYSEFKTKLKEGGYENQIITEKTGKIRPWNFMTNIVNKLINNGIPDNIIILLLLLPLIVTVVSIMKQVVGFTTFGVYIPTIITFTFLIIGLEIGILTLLIASFASMFSILILRKINMMLIPKYAFSLIVTSIVLLIFLTIGIKYNLFSAQFLSIAIFPMLILSTIPEKLISIKSEKGLTSGVLILFETLITAIIAYIFSGGEVNLYLFSFQINTLKNILLIYPEIILLLLIFNVLLGRWSGLRVLERIKFRELFRHVEE